MWLLSVVFFLVYNRQLVVPLLWNRSFLQNIIYRLWSYRFQGLRRFSSLFKRLRIVDRRSSPPLPPPTAPSLSISQSLGFLLSCPRSSRPLSVPPMLGGRTSFSPAVTSQYTRVTSRIFYLSSARFKRAIKSVRIFLPQETPSPRERVSLPFPFFLSFFNPPSPPPLSLAL